MTLRRDNWIEKDNLLNEMRAMDFRIGELRFLAVYLSRIDARDESTREVRFSFDEFVKILELELGIRKVNLAVMRETAKRLLSKVIVVPNKKTGGFTAFQMFKRVKVDDDGSGEWRVWIDAHDEALPRLFKLKHYFKYQVWNALRLSSPQQVRMYEILKQYEHLGERVISVDELRAQLGIDRAAYPDFNTFKRDILDKYQKRLSETTDIRFNYEKHGKRGKGGKVLELKFFIEKNEDYTDQFTLDEFIDLQGDVDIDPIDEGFTIDDDDNSPLKERLELLTLACGSEFSLEEMAVLLDKYCEVEGFGRDDVEIFDYLASRYKYLKMQGSRREIKNRLAYLKSLIGKDI